MEILRDCIGRIACKGDAETGLIEVIFKRCKTTTQIPIGGSLCIERDNIVTKINRLNYFTFHIESNEVNIA